MKVNKFGQATPLTQESYEQISNNFVAEIHKIFWAIAWYTGERPQAILKADVGQFYLNPTRRICRGSILFPGNTRKDKVSREIPCHRNLEILLRDFECPQIGYLFPSRVRLGRCLSRQAIDQSLRRALKRAGLQGQGYSLYSPRRGFITRLNNLGFNAGLIKSLSGHASLSSLGRYIDVPEEQRKNAINIF
ncbi:tyrosine-type recombinase/integrase [Microcoleus sp. bin38.metabat.b11b12b14.051]|uniref:tyrosine-type recombinase/integrase n=1 Tax=Microcoleus sp. bin38.metabat.b11b12b14.051 TaxID=2742709 RepID=UPI0025E67BD8|nr:tyrosine-type recombinase/integrase [Microcoleus sp. bin38.metabat.b11b12b14.051]